jgi:exonuclease SbcD
MRGTAASASEAGLLRRAVVACCEDPDFDVLVPAPDGGA